jgi:hypothetical protein
MRSINSGSPGMESQDAPPLNPRDRHMLRLLDVRRTRRLRGHRAPRCVDGLQMSANYDQWGIASDHADLVVCSIFIVTVLVLLFLCWDFRK